MSDIEEVEAASDHSESSDDEQVSWLTNDVLDNKI